MSCTSLLSGLLSRPPVWDTPKLLVNCPTPASRAVSVSTMRRGVLGLTSSQWHLMLLAVGQLAE
jgi:hypothetical protein